MDIVVEGKASEFFKPDMVKLNLNFYTKTNEYESALKDVVGSKVSISSNKITISYNSQADLDRIMEILNVEIGE